jgi:site-specific DNA recombinase
MQISDTNKVMEKIACAYVRISTEEQSTFSISQQIEAVTRKAQSLNYTLSENNIFVDEGFSAKNTNRPALIKMLSECSNKKSRITLCIAYKIDRLARETVDYLGMRKLLAAHGVKIQSVTEPTDDSPAGEFIETILAATAKYDNMIKAERVKANILQRMKSGLPHGKAKIGYLNFTRPDNKRVIIKDPVRFDEIKEAWRLMETGAYTYDAIAKYLNSRNITTKKGNKSYKLTKQQAQRIFSDKTYCGYVISKMHGIELRSDQVPQMISEDTYFNVQYIVTGRRKVSGIYQYLRPEFPLRRFIRCPVCNEPLYAGFSKGKKKYYGYYFCKTPGHITVSDEKVDTLFLDLLKTLTPTPMFRQDFLDEVKRKWNNQYMDFMKQHANVQTDIDTLKDLKHKIARKNLDGVYSDEFTKEQLEKVEIEILAIKTLQSESNLARLDIEILAAFMDGFLADLSKAFIEAKGLVNKRELVCSIFPNGVTYKNSRLEHLGLCDWMLLIQSSNSKISLSADERT